jgi:hypothetical protein
MIAPAVPEKAIVAAKKTQVSASNMKLRRIESALLPSQTHSFI